MKKPNVHIKKKHIVLMIIIVCFLLAFGITTLISCIYVNKVPTQQAADLWDRDGRSEMISVFLGEDGGITADRIAYMEYRLSELFKTESLEAPSENARLFVSAYSAKTEAYLTGSRASNVSCTAYAVGGDFFRFHPLELVSGCYLKEDDFQKDRIVIDVDAAWKLFGAINVDGMTLTYNGDEYTVIGIVKPETGYKAKAAGVIEGGCVYLPIEAMEGTMATNYEIITPNPVEGFAMKYVKQALQTGGIDEESAVIVDNSSRYDYLVSLKRGLKWNERGMSFKEVKYPYWENQAIAVENVVSLLAMLQLLFIVPPAVIVIVAVIRFHPLHRLKLLCLMIIDKFRK